MKLDGKIGSTRAERFILFALTQVCGCLGEIPVALLRWKLVENRAVDLGRNAGLMLPSNIGELGDSVRKIDLSNHNLRGELSIRTERLRVLLIFTFSTGELPKQLGQLTKLTHLDVSDNELTGGLSTRTERLHISS